uniref:Lipase n=1 Tax=Plectus sambesii TaxID=2011161 RepID=A0A914W2Q3_9BILA
MLLLFVVSSLAVFAAGAPSASPHIPALLDRSSAIGDSDPELNLDTLGIIRRWGYPAEGHSATTQDGYILELHRIPHGKNEQSGGPRPVVFFQHGIEASSSNWVTNLPSESAAFLFADAGFDVWLGNFRGNTYSRLHRTLDPSSKAFWQWSWDQLAEYDLPVMIDTALSISNQTKLYYVGHSMGTTTAFAKMSRDATFRSKIIKFFAMGPVATVKSIQGLFHYIAEYLTTVETILNIIDHNGEFLPHDWFLELVAKYICGIEQEHNPLCQNVLFLIGGPDTHHFNTSRVPIYLAHTPAGTSSSLVIQFGQQVRSGNYQMYDYGSAGKNQEHYGQSTPPLYDLTKVDVPTYLYWGQLDWLADPTDIQTNLLTKLPHIVQNNHFSDFNHWDFIWGLAATDRIYSPIISVIKTDQLNVAH